MRLNEGDDITLFGTLYRITVARNGKLILSEVLPNGKLARPMKRKPDGRMKRQTQRGESDGLRDVA